MVQATKNKRRSITTGAKKPLNYATPALDKGLDILELLAQHPTGMTKSQMARELGRTVSEIFRMLLCLERRGYIAQLSEENYSLTLRMFELVQQHPPTERLIADALPVMQRLADATVQSCHLGVLDRGRVVILAQQNAPSNVGFYVKLGTSVGLMEASSGYVILAHQDEEHRTRTLTEYRDVSHAPIPADLDLHLRRIRKTGYERSPSFIVKGVVNISFPVLNHLGSAVAALTIPYIQYATQFGATEEIAIRHLKKAASEITAAIGGNTAS